MEREAIDVLLKSFVGDEENGRGMNHPMPIVCNEIEYNSATNDHRFILIPINGGYRVPNPTSYTVNLVKVIPDFDINLKLDIYLIRDRVQSVPLVDEKKFEDCSVCLGEGEIYVGDGDYEDCHECDGKGIVDVGFTGKKIPALNTLFTINGALIANRVMHDILFAFETSGAKSIALRHSSHERVNVFEFDNGIIIGAMPCANYECFLINIC